MNEAFIDGSMLQPGNREGVRQTCGLAADRLRNIADRAGVGHDDILDHVLSALTRIAAGDSPDEAFGWARDGKGRQPGNHANRDWNIRMSVRARMRAGESREQACSAVSAESGGEFLLGFESIKAICRGLTADSGLPMPEDVFPADPTPYRR